jgi:adenylyltransferase/sulfurtransferase
MSEFYLRQASVPSLGAEALARLRAATVVVAGVGGVGSSAAYHLTRSGVGRIRLIDQDIIEPSNLQRIHSATRDDLFHPKAEVLSQRLSEFDRSSQIESVVDTITQTNADSLLSDATLVLDGLDNFRTRYILNRFSIRTKTAYLFASAVAQQGHLALLHPPNTPCLECIMPHIADRREESCETLGVTPTITGTIGAMTADAAVQFISNGGTRLTEHLMTLDLSGPSVILSKVHKRKDCTACGDAAKQDHKPEAFPSVTLLCGERTANAVPPTPLTVQLSRVQAAMSAEHILASSESVLVFRKGVHTISLFRNGRVLIGNVDEETEASRIVGEIWQNLAKTGYTDIIPLNHVS